MRDGGSSSDRLPPVLQPRGGRGAAEGRYGAARGSVAPGQGMRLGLILPLSCLGGCGCPGQPQARRNGCGVVPGAGAAERPRGTQEHGCSWGGSWGRGGDGGRDEALFPTFCPAGTRRLPEWVPDSTCSQCSACRSPFTLLRRRHHCRSCGKVWAGGGLAGGRGGCPGVPAPLSPALSLSWQIFCARCSPHTAALPHYGQPRPVRVCTHCYAAHLSPAPRRPRSR